MKSSKAITLIALVITVVILIILAGVAINLTIGENGIFNKAKHATESYSNSEELEMAQIDEYGNKIDEITGSRGSTAKKQIIFKTSETGTREVDLNTYNCSASDFDFIIVYHRTMNVAGSIVFDTSETATYRTAYTWGDGNVFGLITLNIEQNKIIMTPSGNNNSWIANTYLTKVIGVKL